MSAPKVAVVVVSYETRDELLACLASVQDHAEVATDVVVVDNASADGSGEAVGRAFPAVRLLANAENRGFAAACNQGTQATQAPLVLFLNPDAVLTPRALPTMVRLMDERAPVGVIGPRTRDAEGAPQLSFGAPLSPLTEWRQRRRVRGLVRGDAAIRAEVERACAEERSPGWVSGACLLARREALRAVSGFDEGFFLYEEDVDLCLRIRAAGWRILYTPEASVVHGLGRSMRRDPARARLEYQRSHLRYYAKHRGWRQLSMLRAWMAAAACAGFLTRRLSASEASAQLQLATGFRLGEERPARVSS